MLDILTDGFSKAKAHFSGKTTLSEDNIKEALEDVRNSLLEADVEYGVARKFVERVYEKVAGTIVELKAGRGGNKLRVSPADHFIKACKDELEALMGPVDSSLKLSSNRPSTIMMVGLQGSGKTTTTAKLCKYLIERKKRKPLLVAADTYRPAAVEQLRVLGQRLGVPLHFVDNAQPVDIAKQSIAKAFELDCDVILIDTAGRLAVDEALMEELSQIKSAVQPDNILFVCDAMMGQDAVVTAKSFDDRLNLSGVVITKLDGDARGGAALSLKEILGKPIKFLGIGEDLDRLEEFRPEGLASRILGMGDVVGLMEDFERVLDDDHEEKSLRMLKGKFSFNDFYEQISMIQKMGSLRDLVAKLPMQNLIPKDANIDDQELSKIKSMIDSMTKSERLKPNLFNPSRVKRIALGSGRSSQDVTDLIKKFVQMRKMIGSLGASMGMLGKIPGMGNLAQMAQMRKMAAAGPGGMGDMMSMLGGMGGGSAPKRKIDKDKLRAKKKQERKNKKKNRRR